MLLEATYILRLRRIVTSAGRIRFGLAGGGQKSASPRGPANIRREFSVFETSRGPLEQLFFSQRHHRGAVGTTVDVAELLEAEELGSLDDDTNPQPMSAEFKENKPPVSAFNFAFSNRMIEHSAVTAMLGGVGKYVSLTSRAFNPDLTQLFVP
ncbi:uncharacterized protein FTOL_11238 [Fusarium torulosum]|uniref:Uncharacterized protein n=1 Tax=Fusarium torulosum TaxID=33205 RepID=A0AAE8MJL6_9HYPO|nr:uncharacterized protein FTOL_11238 [Fusarium torulosum]